MASTLKGSPTTSLVIGGGVGGVSSSSVGGGGSMVSSGGMVGIIGGGGGGELDERAMAKASLDAAEDALESLCAVHAGTFVAVEKRGQRMEGALTELLTSIRKVQRKVKDASLTVWNAQQEEPEEYEYDEAAEMHPDDDDELIMIGEQQQQQQQQQEGDEKEDQYNDENDDENDNNNQKKKKKKSRGGMSLAVLSEKHRMRRRTLLQHSALLELLELPSLMDACVRSNLYDEALGIASLANTLEQKRGTNNNNNNKNNNSSAGADVVVVAHVVSQIKSRQDDLRRHLLHRLEANVTMPDCLEVVTALRRLNSIDLERRSSGSGVDSERLYRAMEVQLQIDFLEARNVWLDTVVVAAAAAAASASNNNHNHNNPSATMTNRKFMSSGGAAATAAAVVAAASSSEDMLDTIERYRTRVFEVVTQFNAIFRAQQQQQQASSITGATAESLDDGFGSSSSSSSHMSSADLLSLWTCRRIHAFLHILQRGIQQAAALGAALEPTPSSSGGAAQSNYRSANITTTHQQHQQQPQFGAATLRDWLEATLFFATSMGRLGADFTAHLIPTIFEDALVHWIVQHCWIQQGMKPLQDVWAVCLEANVAAPLIATGSSSSSSSSSRNYTSSVIAWSQSNPDIMETMFQDFVVPDTPEQILEDSTIGPLRVLMQVPPLGRFVNAILHGLNELRRCLLPSALHRLVMALDQEILIPLTKELKTLEKQCLTTAGKDRILRDVISQEYLPLWLAVIVPYCKASLWTAMGRATLAWTEYRNARSAIDEQIDRKRKVVQAALELEREKQQQAELAAAQQQQAKEAAAIAATAAAKEAAVVGQDQDGTVEGDYDDDDDNNNNNDE